MFIDSSTYSPNRPSDLTSNISSSTVESSATTSKTCSWVTQKHWWRRQFYRCVRMYVFRYKNLLFWQLRTCLRNNGFIPNYHYTLFVICTTFCLFGIGVKLASSILVSLFYAIDLILEKFLASDLIKNLTKTRSL